MREAADTLGISTARAKSRLFRARRHLRSKLKSKGISVSKAYRSLSRLIFEKFERRRSKRDHSLFEPDRAYID